MSRNRRSCGASFKAQVASMEPLPRGGSDCSNGRVRAVEAASKMTDESSLCKCYI